MAKLKINNDHDALITAMMIKFKMTREQVGYILIENGFIFLRLVKEENSKLMGAIQTVKEGMDKESLKQMEFMYELWVAGGDEPEDNSNDSIN